MDTDGLGGLVLEVCLYLAVLVAVFVVVGVLS